MDPWVYWVTFISPFFYGNEGMNVVQWQNIDEIECEAGVECHYENGQDVLDFYHFDVIMTTKLRENDQIMIVFY